MTSRFATLALDAVDVEVVVDFWRAVLDWEVAEVEGDVVTLSPPDGRGPSLDVIAVPEHKTLKNRLHLDLRADGSSMPEELERLLALGARRVDVGQDDDVTWTVLADPEGNEFCLLLTPVQDL